MEKKSSDIQAELKRLQGTQTFCEVSNACLFNLIIYTQEPRRTKYFKEVVKTIMSQFPCRVIFIQANPEAKVNNFRMEITKEKSEDEPGIICDQILIEASGQEINRVYFLLLTLFVPDLPIYLIWGQDPAKENTILPHLQYFANRLIFDSETTEDLQVFAWDIQNRIASSPIDIIDMNWARIKGWRDVVAQIFDSPERFKQLTTAKLINIYYNDRPSEMMIHANTQAIYMQAWLASRLNWQFQRVEKRDNSQIIFYQGDHSLKEIHLIPKKEMNYDAEEILEIFGQGTDYDCLIKRIAIDQVQVKASNQYQCLLPFTLLMPTLRSGRTFIQEIFYQKVSDQYAEMLKLIPLVKW